MPEWIAQQTIQDRQPELIQEVAALFKTRAAADWSALLENADCCFTRVVLPRKLLDEPQIRARGQVGVTDEGVPWMRSPIRLGADEIELREAPGYGEHTREILAEIGYEDGAITRLLADGIIRQAPQSPRRPPESS